MVASTVIPALLPPGCPLLSVGIILGVQLRQKKTERIRGIFTLDIQDVASSRVHNVTILCPPELLLQQRNRVCAALDRLAVVQLNTRVGLEGILQESRLDIENESGA